MSDQEMKVTIFGAGGFIGSHLTAQFESHGIKACRGDWSKQDFSGEDLGTVIFCGGVGDCSKVDEVISSHVDIVRHVINTAKYDFLLYVSSTRLYLGHECADIDTPLTMHQQDKRVLFNQVKLLAETVIKSQPLPYAIVRPSNVYGSAYTSKLFLPSLVRDAVTKKEINLYVTPEYSKDYVHIDDVTHAIEQIAMQRLQGLFNIASGENVSAKELVDFIVQRTGCNAVWHPVQTDDTFPPIDVSPLEQQLAFRPKSVISMLDEMIDVFQDKFNH
ncbi:NAD-dependent epimerase/dehydratase family protein [Erwinia sorbitola]|uniref:NAD-dependent epimerase/dehydratase family protein n=1 Tax=Erwinia sorbitola TaxID=2681984 RepID=A0A6I6ES08_9GAMM|nr:NAD(P)-dependent oxidoreductase [Erwinia sorbitola]MTD26400.1 NAD-dependent epimerase/dehydratase family protein [Erwinia sorbitola]QGU87013.1 NAD-dependent epimerase/dehydratase family protein [Erwinia sorbitola]